MAGMVGQLTRLEGVDAIQYALENGVRVSVYGHIVPEIWYDYQSGESWVNTWVEPQHLIPVDDAAEVALEAPELVWVDVPRRVCA